jgi:hypothetical protein
MMLGGCCRYPVFRVVKIHIKEVGVRFERSRRCNKKVLAADNFRIGADCRFLVNLGVAKRSFAFYCWLHSRIFGFAAYTVG